MRLRAGADDAPEKEKQKSAKHAANKEEPRARV